MVLTFISVFVACFGVPCRQGLCYSRGSGAEQFPVFPGQQLLLQFYACAVTCSHSFTVLSVWGVLISFCSVLVFSPTLLSLLFLLPYYYYYYYYYCCCCCCCCCCYFCWLLLLLLFPQGFWLCVMGTLAGAWYGGWG